jgi:RNA-binding protein YhbY
MLIYSSILTESYCLELADNLNALVRDGNYPILAQRLGITEKQAAAIRKVTMRGALETVPEEDRLAIIVTVRIKDNGVLPDLQRGIINYIAQNEFVKVRVEERKRAYEELIARVAEEIEKLEAVKQRIAQGTGSSSGSMVLMNPSDAYVRTVELLERKLGLEERLRLVSGVQLVEGFTPLNKPVSPKLAVLLASGLIAGIILAAVIIGLRYAWVLAQRDE